MKRMGRPKSSKSYSIVKAFRLSKEDVRLLKSRKLKKPTAVFFREAIIKELKSMRASQ